jgi:ATP-dependent Clp protease protease subunit
MNECTEQEARKDAGPDWVEKQLRQRRTILLSGVIDDDSAETIVSRLLALDTESPKATIDLVLNSGGGSISSGFAIYDTIRFIKAPVRIICTGLVASMGVAVLLSVPPERRLSMPSTRFMIHQPLIHGTMVAPAADLEISAREMVRMKDAMNRLISEATGKELAQVQKDTLRDYWMSAPEAQAYGLLSRVITRSSEL